MARALALNDAKKSVIVALLAVGCSQRVIARYVGCGRETIRRTMARDPHFAARVRDAKCSAEVGLLRNIRDAAKKEQHWRAAAWMLERGYPERYARRDPTAISIDQIAALLAHFCRIVVEEVPVARYRKKTLKRLDELGKQLAGRSLYQQRALETPPPPGSTADG
ncbi:MAG: hypothetical protein ABSG86_09905 [Thermoguttaceae bacterium]|jgi:hypothetical protein